ncbi:Kv channel-interacting protein 4-like protein, partial [Scophthalmus maximus]
MACRLPRTELHRLEPWAACDLSDMLTMNLEGLEMIAVLVVVVVFVKVLEQFGLLEAGYD